jgi:hypothetical protein
MLTSLSNTLKKYAVELLLLQDVTLNPSAVFQGSQP